VNLNVKIEELVLEGVEDGQEAAVLAALRAELTRLFNESSLSNPAAGRLALPTITVAATTEPATIGQHIGQVIYGAVTNE